MTQKVSFSEKHDFVMGNVFEVQDEIGRRVVESPNNRSAPGAHAGVCTRGEGLEMVKRSLRSSLNAGSAGHEIIAADDSAAMTVVRKGRYSVRFAERYRAQHQAAETIARCGRTFSGMNILCSLFAQWSEGRANFL